MTRILSTAAILCASFALADETAPAAAPQKLGVLPFASLSGEVPPRAGLKASGMLSTELKNAEGLQFVDLRKAGASESNSDALLDVRKSVDEAKEQRKKKKFRLAS